MPSKPTRLGCRCDCHTCNAVFVFPCTPQHCGCALPASVHSPRAWLQPCTSACALRVSTPAAELLAHPRFGNHLDNYLYKLQAGSQRPPRDWQVQNTHMPAGSQLEHAKTVNGTGHTGSLGLHTQRASTAQWGLALALSTCTRRQGCRRASTEGTCSRTAVRVHRCLHDGHSWARRAVRARAAPQVHAPCPQGCAHPTAPREHTCAVCQQDTCAERAVHAAAPSHCHWHPAG